MGIILNITYFIWFLSEVIIGRLLRSSKNDKKQADKNTLLLIWVAIFFGILSAIFVDNKWYLPISTNQFPEFIGLGVIVMGVVLRLLIIKSLGHFFTVDVAIREKHQLKTDGFYRFLRHPSYFTSLLSFVGFGISLNNWVSLLIITSVMFLVFIRRIKIEETVLIEQFGDEYETYKKTTKAFIPFIY